MSQLSGAAGVSQLVAFSTVPSVALAPGVFWRKRVSSKAGRSSLAAAWLRVANLGHGCVRREPAHANKAVKSFVFDSVLFCESDQGDCLLAGLYQNAVSPVLSLLSACRPSAVVRCVVSVCVDPVERMIGRRPRPQVGKKRREIVSPPIAHRNTSPSIVVKSGSHRVVAAVLGVAPGFVLARLMPSFSSAHSGAVLQGVSTGDFSKQASATSRAAISQRLAVNDGRRSAVADALPLGVTSCGNCSLQYEQTSEPQTSEIVEFHRQIIPHRVTL